MCSTCSIVAGGTRTATWHARAAVTSCTSRRRWTYWHVGEILPSLRNDREFLQLLIDTLSVERPAYRELHAYIVKSGWTV